MLLLFFQALSENLPSKNLLSLSQHGNITEDKISTQHSPGGQDENVEQLVIEPLAALVHEY